MTSTAVTLYSGQLVAQSLQVRSYHIGASHGVMKRRVDHPLCNRIRYFGPQTNLTHSTSNSHPISRLDTPGFSVRLVNFEHVLFKPADILGTTGLRTNIVLAQRTTGGE